VGFVTTGSSGFGAGSLPQPIDRAELISTNKREARAAATVRNEVIILPDEHALAL
jgi:hypothetical protein